MAQLFAGTRTGKIAQVGINYTDDGATYDVLAHSERVAPGGVGGECIFTSLFVVTRHFTTNCTWWLTPIVDGVALEQQRIDLVGAATTTGIRTSHQLGLSLAYVRSAVEILRTAPRGTWFELLVETKASSVALGKQMIESVYVEHEVVRETQQPGDTR